MASYLDTTYPQAEYAENLYPQKLCNHLSDKYFTHSGKLLDIGSGRGNHLVGFVRNGHTVYGLDKRRECFVEGFDIRECDIETEKFPYEGEFFDWIFSKSVLEHVYNADNFINETLRVLKTGGKVVLMTPAWESQYKMFWDDYTHVKAFTKKSLQNALKIAGFKNVEVSYFLQLPFIWKYPYLKVATNIIAMLPDELKWKDNEQSDARRLLRFSKEKMLLAYGSK